MLFEIVFKKKEHDLYHVETVYGVSRTRVLDYVAETVNSGVWELQSLSELSLNKTTLLTHSYHMDIEFLCNDNE